MPCKATQWHKIKINANTLTLWTMLSATEHFAQRKYKGSYKYYFADFAFATQSPSVKRLLYIISISQYTLVAVVST